MKFSSSSSSRAASASASSSACFCLAALRASVAPEIFPPTPAPPWLSPAALTPADDEDDDDGSANGASTWSRMRGGRLLLRHPKRPPRHAELRQRQLKQRGQLGEDEDCVVDLAVRPVKNRLVHFRGDAEHCVEAFATSGGSGGGSVLAGRRVSLVLEQYRVPPGHFDFTTRFELVDPKDYLRCFKD
mmetsp:Transcript_76269/g.149404  ORF Transcript_76269/g.149404 Transcript_76269/m.149404 type:complete len:187 (-) Transcript_76269:211-771(-)